MELTRGRGLFLTVMAGVEVPSDMNKREIDIKGLRPPEKFFDHTL